MRLTLKNTFLDFDLRGGGEGEGGWTSRSRESTQETPEFESDAETPCSRHRSSGGAALSASPVRRSRSAESARLSWAASPQCWPGSSEKGNEEDGITQLDRLNCLLGSPLRPSSSFHEKASPFCLDEEVPKLDQLRENDGQEYAVPGPRHIPWRCPEEYAANDKGVRASGASSPRQSAEENMSVISARLHSCNSVSTTASVGHKEYCHKNVPRHVDLEAQFRDHAACGQLPTTLMIRNIPNRYAQGELMEELEELGLGGGFDFLYLPLDRSSRASVGYAFVNFVSYSWAERCRELLKGHTFLRYGRGKMAVTSTAHLQGLDANLQHYEKTAVTKAKLREHRPLVIAGTHDVLPPPR